MIPEPTREAVAEVFLETLHTALKEFVGAKNTEETQKKIHGAIVKALRATFGAPRAVPQYGTGMAPAVWTRDECEMVARTIVSRFLASSEK